MDVLDAALSPPPLLEEASPVMSVIIHSSEPAAWHAAWMGPWKKVGAVTAERDANAEGWRKCADAKRKVQAYHAGRAGESFAL